MFAHTVRHVWRLETTLEIWFLLLHLCGFWEWNLGHRLVWQVSLPTEPSSLVAHFPIFQTGSCYVDEPGFHLSFTM